ncbi:phosphotransferase [Streptomyces echinatus]|uniref:Homoserine kinase type II n=1 Tax=Streptomyces echinatus TaxID=67293 RepID=A0A7W9UPW6_9ACTN|nr:phosphotransferase [Streptomyces echinatus]MBB5926311.1 homoserine kinase type II [Streptomyces echinatus]
MTNAHVASRHRIPSNDLAELIKEFDLGDVVDWRHLADGLMNVNWQLDTPRGTFALKRVTDVPLDRLCRNLAVLPALAEAGIPVIVPVVASSGGVVVEVSGSGYCLFPWGQGAHIRGVDLPRAQVRRLGTVLAKLHLALRHAAETGVLSAVPVSLTTDVVTPERAAEKADRLAAAARARGSGDSFDAAALDALAKRRVLLAEYAALRPEGDVPAGPYGWTHGDFQYRNLLWADGELTAVLDWDRLGVRPYAEEVVRTAQVQFGVEGVFDLERMSAFVSGYRSVVPLESAALLHAARRLWWKRMTDFWQLEFHYDRGDYSCDGLFIADQALLHWWTERLDEVERAFGGAL